MLAACVALAVSACSGSSSEQALPSGISVSGNTLGPRAFGDRCVDQPGDLESAVTGSTAKLAQPAGIDITVAEAKVVGDRLRIQFDTVGPIDSATNPLFIVQQGDLTAALDISFEIRAQPRNGNQWGAQVIRFANRREQPAVDLPGTVTVNGNQLVVDVPMASLPKIATAIWQFGSSSGVANQARVFDDCQPFASPGTDAPAGAAGTTTPPTAPPAEPSLQGIVGTPITASDGSRITVRQVQVPAQPNRAVKEEAIPGDRLAGVEAQVCAGKTELQNIGDKRFSVQVATGQGIAPWPAPDYTNDPRFPAGVTLRPGECVEGWITYEIPQNSPIISVTYDVSGVATGPFVVFNNA